MLSLKYFFYLSRFYINQSLFLRQKHAVFQLMCCIIISNTTMDYQQKGASYSNLSYKHSLSETTFDPPSQQKLGIHQQEQIKLAPPLESCNHSQGEAPNIHQQQIKQVLAKQSSYSSSSFLLQSEFQRQFALIQIINHQIYQIADRNEAYACNYPHFLMLLGLTLQEIRLTIAPAPRIDSILQYLIRKLQRPHLKKLVKESHYYDFLTLMTKTQKRWLGGIHELMFRMLRQERQVGVTVFPYYFNLFALVANKQIIFLKEERDQIGYTVDYRHEKVYENFTRQHVRKEWQEIEKRTIQRYHSEDL